MKSVTLGPIVHLGEAVPLGKAVSIGASTASHGEHRPPQPPEPTLKPSEAILARMDAEMPGLRDSLVCWYCPKLQLADDGMTAEEFNDILAEEYPQYDGGLRDLSGNGLNMTLYGFDGAGGGSINEFGQLTFDGVDDWARNSEYRGYPSFTYIADFCGYKPNKGNTIWGNSKTQQIGSFFGPTLTTLTSSYVYSPFRKNQNIDSGLIDFDQLVIFTPTSINANPVVRGTAPEGVTFTIARARPSVNAFTKLMIGAYIDLSKELSASELDWIKINMT